MLSKKLVLPLLQLLEESWKTPPLLTPPLLTLLLLFLLGLNHLILQLVVLINGLVKLLPLTQLLLMLNTCLLIKKVQSLLLYLLQSELDPYSVPLLLFHSLSLLPSSIDRYDIHDLFNIYKKLISKK